MRSHHLRDCKAWEDEGLSPGTASNEAAKYYDAALTQLMGWYDDPEVGGLLQTMENMVKADPDFVLGIVFNFGLKIVGTLESIFTNPALHREYEALGSILESRKNSLSSRESLHLKAVLAWAEGKVRRAAKLWEEILLDFPTDIHALKMANISYLYLGQTQQLRDSPARVLPFWEAKRPPLKSFIYGFYSYGLEENNQYELAERYAKKALDEQRHDGWATHSLAHVFEMEGRTQEGIQWMNSTVQNWEKSAHLETHNYWHVALFHIENEDYEAAVHILESEIFNKAQQSRTMLDILDTSSLIYRLYALNPTSVKEIHWEKVLELTKPYSGQDHVSTFNDVHFMMAFSGCKNKDLAGEMLESLRTSNKNGGELSDHPNLSLPLLQAIVDFRDEKYSDVVAGLEPLKYDIVQIGGSHAQRDIFNLLLIVAALKSNCAKDKKLARVLISEREALKSTPLCSKFKSLCVL